MTHVRLAVLGDSIAWGQGADRDLDRLGPRLVAGLNAQGIETELGVLAAPGARSADLRRQVDAALRWQPDVTVIVIGANDLTHLEPVTRAVEDLRDAVTRMRQAGIEVVVAAAPDLSAVPHVPEFLRPVVQAASEDLRRRQILAVTAAGGRIGDPDERASRAFATDATLFAPDRFHPSSAGYAVIAAALLPEVLAAAHAASG